MYVDSPSSSLFNQGPVQIHANVSIFSPSFTLALIYSETESLESRQEQRETVLYVYVYTSVIPVDLVTCLASNLPDQDRSETRQRSRSTGGSLKVESRNWSSFL